MWDVLLYLLTTHFFFFSLRSLFVHKSTVTDDGYYQQQQNGNGNDNNQDNNEEDDQVPEAAEWCQMVFEGDMEPTPMNNCGGNNDEGGRKLDQDNNNNNDDGQSYTLAEDYIDNGYYVCQALNGFGGEGEHLYDKSGSGSMYQYSGTNQKSQNWGEHVQQQKNGSKANAGVIVFFVALIGAAMAIGGFMFYKKQKSSDNKREPMLQMEQEKQGAMA